MLDRPGDAVFLVRQGLPVGDGFELIAGVGHRDADARGADLARLTPELIAMLREHSPLPLPGSSELELVGKPAWK